MDIATMSKNFSELRAQMSPERRQRNQRRAERMLLDVTLQELRKNIAALDGDDVALVLDVAQGCLDNFKKEQTSMRLSNRMFHEVFDALKRADVAGSIGAMDAPEGVDCDWVLSWSLDEYRCFLEPVRVDDMGVEHWVLSTGEDHATLGDAAQGSVDRFLRQSSTE